MGKFDYPLSITGGRYLTQVGGLSEDLGNNRIGIHREALKQNTDLSYGDRVLLDSLERIWDKESSFPRPLFMRETFFVEPIDDLHDSRLVAMSNDGEAVLPEVFEEDLQPGDEIVLNASVNRIPSGWLIGCIRDCFRRTNSS